MPEHFRNIRADIYQIMPNHLHGIIEILENKGPSLPAEDSCRGLINQTPTEGLEDDWILMKQPGTTLGKIVRSFKARCSRLIREAGYPSFRWQRNFYDHIIRPNLEHYFIEQYINLNPILWHLDSDNPTTSSPSIADLRDMLKRSNKLSDFEIAYFVESALNYREWKILGNRGAPPA